MASWALKLSAVFVTLFTLVGSFGYASEHVKNVNAPLQPPVADKPAATAGPSPTPMPSIGPLITIRPGQKTPPPGSQGPRLNLEPGVRTATLAPLTFTHVS